jgi:hypothetical protein
MKDKETSIHRGGFLLPVLGLAALLGCGDRFGTDARQPEADVLAQLEPGIHPVRTAPAWCG